MYGRIRGMRIKRLGASTRQEPRERALVYGLEGADFVVLLEEMRSRAGLSIPQIAAALGVYPNAVYQYFHKKRGRGGTSTLRWFLRYASACGCEVTLTFPVPKRGRTRYGTTAHQAGGDGPGGDDTVGGTDHGSRTVFLGRGDAGGDPDRV